MTLVCGNNPKTAASTALADFLITWAEIPFAQYWALPETVRDQIDVRTRGLRLDPTSPPAVYSSETDLWTLDYAEGAGLIVYAAVLYRQRVIILRLIDLN